MAEETKPDQSLETGVAASDQHETASQMQTQEASAASAAAASAAADALQKDVAMSDAPMEHASSPVPVPVRTGTPAQGSRAPSVHPEPAYNMPTEAAPHGDPVRRYLNTKVTGVLLDGMKQLARDQPSDPLRVLGDYLIQRSKDLEGTN